MFHDLSFTVALAALLNGQRANTGNDPYPRTEVAGLPSCADRAGTFPELYVNFIGGPMAEKTAPRKALHGKPRVLIVEDEVLLRVLVAEAARDEGYRVVEATNAEAALGYIATGRRVDLLFSDINLPGSIDGEALAQRLAAERADISVILTSGRRPATIANSTAKFICKPYSVREVLAAIADALAQKPPNG